MLPWLAKADWHQENMAYMMPQQCCLRVRVYVCGAAIKALRDCWQSFTDSSMVHLPARIRTQGCGKTCCFADLQAITPLHS